MLYLLMLSCNFDVVNLGLLLLPKRQREWDLPLHPQRAQFYAILDLGAGWNWTQWVYVY